MGSYSNLSRSDRFIKAFNDWAKQAFPLPEKAKGLITKFGLGYCRDDTVQLFWTYDDGEHYTDLMVYDTPLFYDPNEDDLGVIERLEDAFRDIGVTREQVVQKLKEAELLSPHFK
jgi:hypothetical protein